MPRYARGRAASAAQAAPAIMPASSTADTASSGDAAFGQREADAGRREGAEIELALGADVPKARPVGERYAHARKARSAPPC